MNSIVKNLLKKGVVKGESKILSNEEVKELEYLIIKSKDKYRKKGEVSLKILLVLIKK